MRVGSLGFRQAGDARAGRPRPPRNAFASARRRGACLRGFRRSGELLLTDSTTPATRTDRGHRRGTGTAAAAVPTTAGVGPLGLIDVGDIPLDVVRRLADGRSSFVARTEAPDAVVCFSDADYESSGVHLAASPGRWSGSARPRWSG